MKILAVDTSTHQLNVAITEDECERIDISLNAGKTHSKYLMPMIDTALNLTGMDPSMIDGFAVTIGPGSFTGLRIGLSAIQGFASALDKPVAGVSSLEALAFQCRGFPFLICALLDARKNEVYASFYRFSGNRLHGIGTEQVLPIAEVIRGIDEKCLFLGNGAQLYQRVITDQIGDLAVFPSPNAHIIRASSVAHLGRRQLADHPKDPSRRVLPLYLRPSDAEYKTIKTQHQK